MFLYLPIETTQFSQYCGHYLTFGLAAVEIFPYSAALVEFIADIFTDKKAVASLACCCTFYQLEPIHLINVIEDFI